MYYFRISQINGFSGPIFCVEFTQNYGQSWTTMSFHTSHFLADRDMRSYVAMHRSECDFWRDSFVL